MFELPDGQSELISECIYPKFTGLTVNILESLAEAWVNNGLPQGQRQSWETDWCKFLGVGHHYHYYLYHSLDWGQITGR